MTSEVLMMNKDAVVIAADSAVTTGREPHPRYAKSANKIFDLSPHGNVALTIYSNADVDRVPWELALKLFRKGDKDEPQRPMLEDYCTALIGFLQGNNVLFPPGVRHEVLKRRMMSASQHVLNTVAESHPALVDESLTAAERGDAWQHGRDAYNAVLAMKPTNQLLQASDLLAIEKCRAAIEADLAEELEESNSFKHAVSAELAESAASALAKEPTKFLPSTGLVMAGFGSSQIFPSFTHIRVYGHIGDTLLWSKINDYAITHDNAAWIQPFAQSSMIDRFTDGFDSVLTDINHECSVELLTGVLTDLAKAGVVIDPAVSAPVLKARHTEFMKEFKTRNWQANYYPLRRVLNSLSVSEMGHFAESLLVLEALRERVTSPSESVGGPIDVAVITKAEGLIWLKRKHFFEPELNLRYVNRART